MKRILVLFLACFSLHSLAEEVAGLYSGLVPVANQSAEAREAGVRQALAQVLIKLTGNSEIMLTPSIQSFFTNPNAFVAAIGFRNMPSADETVIQTGLEVSFARQAIDQLIRQAQLPVLPSNRPKLLVWIVRDDALMGRGFIGDYSVSDRSVTEISEDAEAVLQAFDQAMKQRGMPYQLPNFDLQDQLSLSMNEAWSLRADLIGPASERYQTDGWIALRFYTTSTGEVRGAWLYQSAGRGQLNDFRALAGEEFMATAVDSLVDSLARAYTYVPQLNTNELLVQISGVDSFKKYQAVLAQFKKLEVVDSLEISAVKGDQLTLAVDVEGGAELLHSALLRSGRLKDLGTTHTNLRVKLEYSWVSE